MLKIILGLELELTDLAVGRSAHLVGGEIAALDNFQRVDQLLLELLGTAAIEAQRGERTHGLHVAHDFAEIGLKAPEGDEHRTRHAILLLDPAEGIGIFLEQCVADLEPVGRHHAAGELQETLREYALPAVLGDGRGIVGEAVERVRHGAG